MRLDKVLSNRNFGTRSEIKKYIKNGYVLVNDEAIFKSEFKVIENDIVCFDEECFVYNEFEYLVLNKPPGYVCANNDNVYPTIFDILPEYYSKSFHIVGRLDVDTYGLVIITNDGKFTHSVISPKNKVGKIYEVKLKKRVKDEYTSQFKEGITIDDDYKCMSASFKQIDDFTCLLTIYEGKFHQVKKMFIALGNEVVHLNRVAIGNLITDDLSIGEYKKISKDEIYKLCIK